MAKTEGVRAGLVESMVGMEPGVMTAAGWVGDGITSGGVNAGGIKGVATVQ